MELKMALVMKMETANANVTSKERNVMNVLFNTMDSLTVNVSFHNFEFLQIKESS